MIKFSVFGQFHQNFYKHFIQRNKKLLKNYSTDDIAINDDKETFKLRQKSLENVFEGSEILKREIDKVILYYNLPEYIINKILVPSKLYP